MHDNFSLAPNPVSASSIEVSVTENDDVNVTWEVRMYCYQIQTILHYNTGTRIERLFDDKYKSLPDKYRFSYW